MRLFVPAVFLAIILSLLSRRLQFAGRRAFAARPALVFLAPALLTLLFCAIAAAIHALSAPLAVMVAAYTFVPALYTYGVHTRPAPNRFDFVLIAWLWLPIEFAAGARWIPRDAQPLMHMAAYGVAVTLGLLLFLLCRNLPGMKYNLPKGWRDFANPVAGFAVLLPVLWVLGRALSFIQPFHVPPNLSASRVVLTFFVILAATALPEEILFRALIQNSIMHWLGTSAAVLALAAVIFGAAHLDNGPQAVPNWRYMILATIAGYVYGRVFQKSTSIFASAILHSLIDTSKHLFF